MSREFDIFADALELARSERTAFLDRACQGDKALRTRIEALLAGHDEAVHFLDRPAAPCCALRTEEEPGAVLGRYTLREKIGEGGCGVVWVADQSEPVKRRVALKVIKLGMDTREVVARFEAERQALALMDHPNIAKVFDAGATATGRPFFVMELVRGTAITRFCDDRNLSTRTRLELFIEVCHAIQHAHQKGIIHRDIKPSNVLVTLHDDKPVPMVIDFGIAKATQGRLTDQTLFTAFEQFIGTPAYMSPEQAEHNALDVDTRSDIYSLGVLLYELLTGRPPFDPKTLQEAGLEQMRRIIREAEPPRPSTRVRTLDDAERSTVARLRSTAPAQLPTLLRGDLDWIVLKALEKNRVRRYQTANAFAADIERSLAHEVVIARPPSTAYRLRQFIARHTVGFAAATTAVVLLLAGLAGLAVSLVREKAARELAVEAQRLATKRAAQVDFVLGSRLLDEGKIADGLAYLVSAARKDPDNPVIAPRLLSALVSRNFLLPEGKPLVMPSPVAGVRWPSGGRRIFVRGEDRILRTINADTWQIEHEFQFTGKLASWGTPERNPDVCAALLDDNSIAVGDATAGRLKIPAIHPPKNAPLISVGVSPDGRWIAAHGPDTVWIWDANTGELRTTLPHKSNIARQQWAPAYPMSPDGDGIATLGSRNVYQIWSLPEGKPIGPEFRGPTGAGAAVLAATFSPDGRLFAVKYGRGAQLYDAATGAPQGPLIAGTDDEPIGVKFTPDSRRLVVIVDLKAVVQDVASGNPVFPPLFLGNQPTLNRGFSNDGRILYTAGVDGLVRLWDMETGALLTEPTLQQESAVVAAVAPDGSQVALFTSAGPAYRLRVGRTAARPLQWSNQSATAAALAQEPPTRIIRYLHDRAELIDGTSGRTVAGGFKYPQSIKDPSALRVSTSTGLPAMVARVGSNAFRGWTIDAQGALHAVALDGMPPGFSGDRVVFDWTGEFAAISGNANEEWFGVWNLRTGGAGSIIKPAKQKQIRGNSIQLSPRAQRAAFLTEDWVGHVCDVATGKELFELEMPPGSWDGYASCLFTPDGRQIVGRGGSGNVNFWNAFDGRLIASRRSHRAGAGSGRLYNGFSRDGRFYVSVSVDATAQVWDLTTRMAVGEPLVHDREVCTAVFDSDSSRVVTASADGTARVWDTLTGQPLTAPMRHDHPVARAEFSPDGRFVMTQVTTTGAQATYLWAVPAHSGGASAPEWLLRLATICASKRVNQEGKLIPALDDLGRFEEIRHELAALPADAPFVEGGRWFLSNEAQRPIAPGFTITPSEAKELAGRLPEMTARAAALKTEGN